MQRFRQLQAILKNKDRKQMWKTIKTLDAKEQEIEEIGRTLIMVYIQEMCKRLTPAHVIIH